MSSTTPNASIGEGTDDWSRANSPAFLSRLDRLRLNVHGGTNLHPGDNPVAAATQDSGLEFAKHRPYVPGDDLRHIDWLALARSDAKLIKTFRAEREAPLHILVDTSASMGLPAEDRKAEAAAAIASGLAYISLRRRDPVRVAALGATGARPLTPLLRHPSRVSLVGISLRLSPPTGQTDLPRATDDYLRLTRLPGIAAVLSDFLVRPADFQQALRQLQAGGFAVAAIRLHGEHEREVPLRMRRVRMFDVETRRHRIVDLTPQNRARYQQAMDQHAESLRRWCAANAIPFCTIDTTRSPLQAMTNTLTAAGILR